MNRTEMISLISRSIYAAQQGDTQYEEIFVSNNEKDFRHEFLFFIKPEITRPDDDVNVELILDMMMSKLDQFHFTVKSICTLGASYLDRYNIIAQHYGVINALSRDPLKYLTPDAAEKFKAFYGKAPEEVNVLGSLQFLQQFPDYTPQSLNDLWQKSETVKLAGGSYCASLTVSNKKVYLINGFHPLQIIHFTEKGRSIVAFTLASDTDWRIGRNQFIGKTNPAEADAGSLRNELLLNKASYGLQTVSSSQNGFHLSAGPVEGLVELIRYNSDFSSKNIRQVTDFSFGKILQTCFKEEEIRKICGNASLDYEGKKTNVFDLTEERNADEAIELLRKSKIF